MAPSPAAVTAAQAIASPADWGSTGADDRAVWGACRGSGAEPYDTAVDHVDVAFRCSCPSRRVPCKHAIALLLLWVRGQVPAGAPPAAVDSWVGRRRARATARAERPGTSGDGRADVDDPPAPADRDPADRDPADRDDAPAPGPPAGGERDAARDERVARMLAGLTELDRWLDDRIRTGLADPALARYSTWDALAARLVDAQAGSLANRVRRLAGLVGASPDWHADVLAELGLLHLLTQAGRRLPSLPDPLGDEVATAIGWQVKQADVLGGVPDTDRWVVAGRSDTREDRIEVRRQWLRGEASGRWALVLSFAAYRQSLDDSLAVGSSLPADLHRYPGHALRALVGRRHGDPIEPGQPPASTIAEACDEIGRVVAEVPWLDRLPATVCATPAFDGRRWSLSDDTGSLPLLATVTEEALGVLLAVSAGRQVVVTIEWTPHGVVPLTVHRSDRAVDIGPRANASFVGGR